jgi:tetratricopeptide (TPR) repeat protein
MTILALLYIAASLHDGNVAYQTGKYDEAIATYKQVLADAGDKSVVLFDLGDALYRKQDYSQAESAWDRAARASRESGMVARARYNQGNAAYCQASAIFKTNPQDALVLLQRAANSYSAALRTDPGLRQAQHNLDATREFLRRFKTMVEPTAAPDSSPEQILTSERAPAARSAGKPRRSTANRDW